MTGNLSINFQTSGNMVYNRAQVFRLDSKLKRNKTKNPSLSLKHFIFGKLFGEIPSNLQAK